VAQTRRLRRPIAARGLGGWFRSLRTDRWSELEDVVDPRPASNLESVDQLAAVVASVDPRELRILEQKHLEGRSFVEIAASEGCPTPTIKARYYRALDAVRLRFPTEEGDDENDAR
jgi:DNA-directed RNA polymerase specialized sigma24 family protein